ncbi:glycosyltransferase family 9 protein [Methylomonas sp. LL1]|uniref:glycosyltransferase family 9 protein n=1 Tax=Methylomonas sp. LL1 TaxID=2785785 RepID=UPI0018C387AA|nr:glycosyltransferase family 9 protein [Methylomonas sp. LL1]QPK62109.1 glycosyltransferase family 9 protein [Methylomonas sp. LL1]
MIRRNRLGDAVNLLPVIEGIKQCQPRIEIHVLASQYNAVIFQHSPYVDKVHRIDEKWLLGKLSLFMHPLLLSLRGESFDLVIGLGGYSSVLAQLVFWVKGKYNVGMLSKKGTLYDLAFDKGVHELVMDGKHHVDDMAHIARNAGLALPDPLPYTRMVGNSLKQDNWLAICPDVKRMESRYAINQYAQVVTELLSNNEVNKVILFTENASSVYRELEQYGAQWCSTQNVEEFIREVSQCEWVISAEGGSAHIAGALGLGVIVLSGMGHQVYWRPYAEFTRVLERKNAVNQIQPGEIMTEFRALKACM